MKMLNKSLAIVLSMGLASSASAMTISDVNDTSTFLKEGDSITTTHDLTDDGVPTDFLVTSAELTLGFSDGLGLGDWSLDIADVTGDGIEGEFEVDGTHWFGYDIRTVNIGADGISTLNSSGQLEVTVTAKDTSFWDGRNDFWLKTSRLDAEATARQVPEPASVMLLGLGLLVLGLRRLRA